MARRSRERNEPGTILVLRVKSGVFRPEYDGGYDPGRDRRCPDPRVEAGTVSGRQTSQDLFPEHLRDRTLSVNGRRKDRSEAGQEEGLMRAKDPKATRIPTSASMMRCV